MRKCGRSFNLIATLPLFIVTACGSLEPAKTISTPKDLLNLSVGFLKNNLPPFVQQNEGLPDFDYTPGCICSPTDPDFDRYRYKEQIAYCKRNVPREEKLTIAEHYGVAEKDFSKYEFDHYIPLSIGGANSICNIWPQPRDNKNALDKDIVEQEVFDGLNQATMTQAEAIEKIKAWRPRQ